MYRIIGGDGQEYGPVSAAEVRQWIAEGRLNAQSNIRPEASTEWTTLGALPEFAGSPRPTPAAGPAPMGAPPQGYWQAPGAEKDAAALREAAEQRLKGPAIGLMVTGGLGVLGSLVSFAMHVFGSKQVPPGLPPEFTRMIEMLNGPVGIASDILSLVVSGLIILGALKMMRLQSYGLAFAVSIMGMLPCLSPCCLLGLPFGIWALVVMSKPEVKSQFS